MAGRRYAVASRARDATDIKAIKTDALLSECGIYRFINRQGDSETTIVRKAFFQKLVNIINWLVRIQQRPDPDSMKSRQRIGDGVTPDRKRDVRERFAMPTIAISGA